MIPPKLCLFLYIMKQQCLLLRQERCPCPHGFLCLFQNLLTSSWPSRVTTMTRFVGFCHVITPRSCKSYYMVSARKLWFNPYMLMYSLYTLSREENAVRMYVRNASICMDFYGWWTWILFNILITFKNIRKKIINDEMTLTL